MGDAKAITEWTGEGAGASGGANNCKMWEIETNRASGWTFANYNIELIVFHGRIKDFLNSTTQTVDFVNKKHVAILKICEDRGEIAGTLDGRTRGDTEIGAQLMRNYICHGGFAKTWRTIEKDVI